MSEQKQVNVNSATDAQSSLNERLERLIDGDVTGWGTEDVVAYGMIVAAIERDECARIATSAIITPWTPLQDANNVCAIGIRDAIRKRSNGVNNQPPR